MKKLEFETSKDRFVLIDAKEITTSWYYFMHRKLKPEYNIEHEFKLGDNIFKLSDTTEEQASELFRGSDIKHTHLSDYNKQKLINLIKSKGVHLFKNPIQERFIYFGGKQVETFEYQEAEINTFYSPYIFKI